VEIHYTHYSFDIQSHHWTLHRTVYDAAAKNTRIVYLLKGPGPEPTGELTAPPPDDARSLPRSRPSVSNFGPSGLRSGSSKTNS